MQIARRNMKYTICGIDATLAKNPKECFDHKITANIENDEGEGCWRDFEWFSTFESTPENLKKDVEKWLEKESRIIEVFSVKDENNNVVMTEENL